MRQERTVLLLSVACALLLGALVGSWGWTLAAPARGGAPQAALGTAFAYQGQLRDGGQPADGSYDFAFSLYDALAGGAQVGSPVSRAGVAVSQGFFAVELDFGAVFDGSARYLEIAVKPAGSAGASTTLTPRQSLAPVPYAISAIHGAAGSTRETWRMNHLAFTDGTTGSYGGGSSVLLGQMGYQRFRQVFTARPTDVTVRAARLRVVAITADTYDGAARFQLEVYRQSDGQLLRTLLASPVDVRAQALGSWVTAHPVRQRNRRARRDVGRGGQWGGRDRRARVWDGCRD